MRAALVALLVLGLAGTANAAYAPRLDIAVAGGAPGGPAAVTATITQAQGEEPTRAIETTLPGTFGFNAAFASPGPEGTRIGTVAATSPFGEASGPLVLTEDFRLLARIEAYGGLVAFEAAGILRVLPGQRVVLRFADLPPIPSTSLALAIEGGDRTPLALPRECGRHVITSRLESAGARTVVEGRHPVVVRGCRTLPRIRSARLDGRVLRWRPTRDTVRAEVALLRLTRGKWRGAGVRRTRADALRLPALRPGRYRAEITAVGREGQRSLARAVTFSVRR